MRRYTNEELFTALEELMHDKEAFEAFLSDFSEVLARHALIWLDKKNQPRQEGILIELDGVVRLKCPRCNFMSMKDAIFCGQCGNQLQDSWLEKTRKRNLGL